MSKDISEAFQARRRRFFGGLKIIAAAILLSFAGLIVTLSLQMGDEVALYFFVPFFISVIAAIFWAYFSYRCPECNTLPMIGIGGRSGLDLNPYQCRKCGNILRQN